MTMPEDPFAEDVDEFATAKTEFVGLSDLDGRLVIIVAHSVGTKKGDSGEYKYVDADVIVLDGETTEQVPQLPFVICNMHISGTAVVPQIEGYAGKNKPFLARLDSVPSKRNKAIKVMGVRKHEITEADKMLASPAWRKYNAAPF